MAIIMSLGFEFNGKEYHSLIRVKEKDEETEYHITVMNGELERLLYGNHVVKDINYELELGSVANSEQTILKRQIVGALSRHLQPL